MADTLDTPLVTSGPMGHSISTTLRAMITGSALSIRTALGLSALATASTVAATQLVGGFSKHALVAGAAAGDVTVTAIKAGDELDEVIYYVGAGVAVTNVSDLTAEFTITADGKINNTSGTASTGGKLLVRWTKLTA